MASFGRPRVLGRAIVLLICILILAIGGLIWFDYLGLLDLKSSFGPLYRLAGIKTQGSGAISAESPVLFDEERMAKRLEALQTRSEELDSREADIARQNTEVQQKVQQLDDRSASLDDREKSFNEKAKEYENRKANVEQNAVYLTSMPPAKAVEILKDMDDQMVIDILRAVEEKAAAAGENSIVSYWLSLMPPDRSAAIQRKMAARPSALE
jgi:flagellar protein FlbB